MPLPRPLLAALLAVASQGCRPARTAPAPAASAGEGARAAALPTPPPHTDSALEARVRTRLDTLRAQSTAYARDLATGREIAVRADEPVNTVSVIKLPIMVLAYRDAEAGRLDLDERYALRAEDMRRGTGVLQSFSAGLRPTYRDIVTQMIVTSDNTATDVMIARLGLDRVNRMLDSLGYRETRLRMPVGRLFRAVWEQVDPKHAALTDRQVFERGFPGDSENEGLYYRFVADSAQWFGRTTARETSRFLEQLQRGELASKQSTDEMLAILRDQVYTSRLPRRIQFTTAVGHKTGDWPPIIGNDVGIIYSPRGPIVISVFTNQNRGDFVELEATIGRVAVDVLAAWGR